MKFRLSTKEASMLVAGLCQTLVHGINWDNSLTRVNVEALAASIDHLIQATSAQSQPKGEDLGDISVARADSDEIELGVTRATLRSMVRLLNEVINGFVIWEWEFQTLVGYERAAMRRVFNKLHWYAVTPDRDLLSGPKCPYD